MKKFLRRTKVTIFNTLTLILFLVSAYCLAHDLYIWGIKPLFSNQYVMVTYFGMYLDLFALLCMIVTFERLKRI